MNRQQNPSQWRWKALGGLVALLGWYTSTEYFPTRGEVRAASMDDAYSIAIAKVAQDLGPFAKTHALPTAEQWMWRRCISGEGRAVVAATAFPGIARFATIRPGWFGPRVHTHTLGEPPITGLSCESIPASMVAGSVR